MTTQPPSIADYLRGRRDGLLYAARRADALAATAATELNGGPWHQWEARLYRTTAAELKQLAAALDPEIDDGDTQSTPPTIAPELHALLRGLHTLELGFVGRRLLNALEAAVSGHLPHRRYQVAAPANDQRTVMDPAPCQACGVDLREDEADHDTSDDGDTICLLNPVDTVCELCTPLAEYAGYDDVAWPCPPVRRVLDALT